MADNPFGGLGSSSSGSSFGGLPAVKYPTPSRAKKKKKPSLAQVKIILESDLPQEQKALALVSYGLTPRQTASVLKAAEYTSHRSFGDKLAGAGKGALGGASWAMDKLMRPHWAVTATIAQRQKEGLPTSLGDVKDLGEAAKRGFTGKERQGFGELLDTAGVLKGHRRLRGAAGFGLDVVADPLMLLSLGTGIPAKGGAHAAYLAAKQSGKSVSPKVFKQAAQEAGAKALKGEVDEITEELLVAGGEKYASRLGFLRLNKESATKPIIGLSHEDAVAAKSIETLMSSQAFKEAALHDSKRIYLKYGTRKHNIRVPIAPALARPGEKVSKAGIPVISQITDRLGRGFIPDWKNPLVRDGQVMRQHIANQNTNMQRQLIGKILAGVDEELDPDHFLAGLHYMEQPLKTTRGGVWKAVVPTKTGGFKLNAKYMNLLSKKGLIDGSQRDAIEKYFLATEAMYKFDRAAGVAVDHFGETGRFYVPHVTLRDGDSAVPSIAQRNLLTEAGFQKNRKGAKLSIAQIKKMVDAGDLPTDIETNPWRLLAHRSRAGAERQADMALINTLKATIGVPTRLVNPKSVARATKRQEAALAKHDAAIRVAAHAEADYDNAVQKIKDQLLDVQTKAEAAHTAAAKKIRQETKAPQIKKLEDAIKRASKPGRGKVSAADKQLVAEAKAAQKEAKDLLDSLPEDFPRHNAKIIGVAQQHDHLDDAINDFVDIKRTDFEKGVDGTEEFQDLKQAAWDDVRQAQEDFLAEIEDDAVSMIEEINTAVRGAVPVDAAKVADLEAQLRKVKAARVTTPQIVKNEAKMLGLRTKLDEALKAMDNPRTTVHKQAVSEPLLAHKTAKEALKDAKKELKAVNAEFKKATKGKANKAVRPNMVVDQRAVDTNGHPMAFPQESATAFLKLDRMIKGDDATIDNFVRSFGKWQGAWKVLVTIVNPGYRIRNTMTDMWNMWIAPNGIRPDDFLIYGTKAAKVMAGAKKGEAGSFGWVQEAANHGIFAGIFAGDIARVEKYFKYGGKSARALRKNHEYIALTTKVMQDFNKYAENWGRLTHYLYRRQALGESQAEAARMVKLAHFDYEDLTPFEQKLRDTIFPFYTWTRKNIPYQVKQIFAEPGRYSAFPKLAEEATYVANQPEEPSPEFVETGMGFPIGKNRFFMPQFGVSDLAVFQDAGEPFDRAAAMLSPAIKTPLELYQNKSLFTKQPIASENHPRSPVTPFGAKLLSLIPGSNVGETERGGISGPGANPYYAYLLGQVPGSRVAGVTGPGSIAAKRSGNASLTSWLGGVTTVQSDPAQQAYYDSLKIQDQVDLMLNGLRDEGTLTRPTRRKSTVDQIIEQVLRGNYGG